MKAVSPKCRRFGYAGSGFSFIFARYPDSKSLARATGARDSRDLTGYSKAWPELVFPDVVREQFRGNVFNVELSAVACADARAERRRWHHEIGHAVDFCVSQYRTYVFAFTGRAPVESEVSEFKASLTEYLADAAAVFMNELAGAEPDQAVSTLPQTLPWLGGSK